MPKNRSPRENTAGRVQHPDFMPSGATTWRPGMNLHDLADRLQNGDAAAGWAGDPRLSLAKFRDPSTGAERWELWRNCTDGELRLIATLPSERDPSGIIRKLVQMDAQKGFDLHEAVSRHNAKVDREHQYQSDQKIGESSERLAHSLMRAAGIKTQF